MSRFILAIDQGTTSSRALLFNESGEISGAGAAAFAQMRPRPGWVEHDPEAIWQSVQESIAQALDKANAKPGDIAAIGITNQRETSLVWDRKSGQPAHNAIVWQDRRTADRMAALRGQPIEPEIRQRSGLVPDAYFSASKLEWILQNCDRARELAAKQQLAFGTVDTWLIWKLTSGRAFVTDATNASRTMLFNIHDLAWDPALCETFSVPAEILPEVKGSSEVVGMTDAAVFGAEVPIAGIAGDQQAATFGHLCLTPGTAKNTYGTGAFLVTPTGRWAVPSQHSLLTTIAWQVGGAATYALEGSIFTVGTVINWLVEGLGLMARPEEIDALAGSVEDNGGVAFVPALAGLGAPYWDQFARGTMLGLTAATSKAHLARAALEGIAGQVYDVVKAVESDIGEPLRELRADGGASKSNLLMQIQADLLGIPIIRARMSEMTARGAAFLAGLAVGYWPDTQALLALPRGEDTFEPNMTSSHRDRLLTRWHEAVERARGWEDAS